MAVAVDVLWVTLEVWSDRGCDILEHDRMARRNRGSAEVREVNTPIVHIRGGRGSERTMLAIVVVKLKSWSRVPCNYENSAPTLRRAVGVIRQCPAQNLF